MNWKDDEPDNICFDMISDELNGVSRDLRRMYNPNASIEDQEGIVRTKVKRTFASCWEAIFENALSRVWLGVHWCFDACAAQDVVYPVPGEDKYEVDGAGRTKYRPVNNVRYETPGESEGEILKGKRLPIGGIGLGIEIANDIYESKMVQSPVRVVEKASDTMRFSDSFQ